MFGQVDNIARFKPDFHRPVKTPGGKVLEIGNGFPHSLSLPDFDILFGLILAFLEQARISTRLRIQPK